MEASMVTFDSLFFPFTFFPCSFSMVTTSCPLSLNALTGALYSISSNISVKIHAILLMVIRSFIIGYIRCIPRDVEIKHVILPPYLFTYSHEPKQFVIVNYQISDCVLV